MNAALVQKSQRILIGIFLFLTCIAVFVPLNPQLPQDGLDPSWAFTLNEAVSQKWVFGKDVIFTFGPYASIWHKTYHPGIDKLMLGGSLFLSAFYAGLLFLFFKKTKVKWAFVYTIFIAAIVYFIDPLLSSYPFILGLLVYRTILPQDHPDKIELNDKLRKIFPLFFSPLGLILLIKGSTLPLCAAAGFFSFLLFWRAKEKKLAYTAALAATTSCIIFWALSGQPIFAIFYYFLNIFRIASNYTEAMAIPGDPQEILLFTIASLFILFSAFTTKNVRLVNKLLLILFVFFFLFVVFKAGFVRHDGHVAVATPFLLLVATLLMNLNLNKSMLTVSILFSIVTWVQIDNNHFKTNPKTIINHAFKTYSNFYKGIKLRTSSRNKLKMAYDKRLCKIQKKQPIHRLEGSTDIYSFQQSYLLSSANSFSFRPIFQSYSAYSPELIKLNEMFLRNEKAPENILFRIEALDARFPALEEGLSWPTILQNYFAVSFEGGYIYFKKRKTNQKQCIVHKIEKQKTQLNKEKELPDVKEGLYAEIEIEKRLLGKLISFFYKPSDLIIRITLSDGAIRDYRFISTMGKTKFLISPLVENTEDFLLFAQNKNEKFVKTMKIKGDSRFWNRSCQLKLYKIEPQKSDKHITSETTNVCVPNNL